MPRGLPVQRATFSFESRQEMKKIFFCVLIFFLTIQSFANENVVQRFRDAAIATVRDAQAKGIYHINGIKLSDVENAAKTVLISYQKGFSVNYGNRHCASWQNTKDMLVNTGPNRKEILPPRILLNEKCTQLTTEQLKGVALHEVLGVTYGVDMNYEISARLLSGTTLFDEEVVATLIGGGSTGIGGGGDYDDLKFKIAGLRKIEELKIENRTSFVGYSLLTLAKKLLAMDISQASNVDKLAEYRRPGVEQNESKTYIVLNVYRMPDEKSLRSLALLVSVFEATYGLDSIASIESKNLDFSFVDLL
jgi:hypothetical protein